MHFKALLILTSCCIISLAVFAHEAPVVDIQQQNAVVGTQSEGSTGGNSWQPVSPNSNTTDSSQQNNNGWQPVTSQPNTQPTSSQNNSQSSPTPIQEASPAPVSDSVDRRVERLEQQMSNYTQMNLPQQISDLQQKNAVLQGQLEVAQHSLQTLTDQQKLYYQDIEQQLSQLKQSNTSSEKQPTISNNNNSTTADDSSGFVEKNDATENNSSDLSSEKNITDTSQNQITQTHQMSSLSDADTYGKAFRLLSGKHFNDAQTGFQQYLNEYPKGRFSVNAHFWLGEIALMHEKYRVAEKQFQTVVTQYPKSNQVSDAKLKIAMIHAATGKMELAHTEFLQIRKLYPGTTAAQLANIRLQQLANATSIDSQ